ncbi:MAG: hypothetical protein OH338_03195 [Candidatus Parvarchaeota archaeon]|nr:hypothetical protein [Candidatus Parvarchaeum tengchongense]MCW1295314.1 hypothetical protein [Candidatus Parvarchaeum tengchongense]MCW1312411.1 hypothetical protein [Candidatus Parvarchaeum tengchongense]
MVYYSQVNKKEILIEEFGVEKLTKRVIICPIEWNRVLPDDWIDRLKKKYKVETFKTGDRHLSKIEKNYRIKDTLFLFINRGVAEATDRFYILAKNPKVKDIIFLGTAASLVDDLDAGDINIPKFVLPWEELSSEYVNAFEFLPVGNTELINNLTKRAKKYAQTYNLKVKNDNHATVELFYGETVELLKFFKQMSISTIDMELSALYRLAIAFGKKAAGILEVGDRPLHKEEFFSQKHKNKKNKRNESKEVIFKIVESLLQN